MMVRTGLKTDSCGALLWRRYWSFRFYKWWGISLFDGATPTLFVIQGLGRLCQEVETVDSVFA